MKNHFLILFIFSLFLGSCSLPSETPIAEFSTSGFRMQLSDRGNLMALTDPVTGKNHLAQDSLAPIMSLRVKGIFKKPHAARFKKTPSI